MAHAGYAQFPTLSVVDAKDYSAVCARLDTIMGAATPAQVIDGMGWYGLRAAHMARLATRSGRPVEIIACATSVLSAQTRWDKNERAIDTHVDAYLSGATSAPVSETLYRNNDTKAWEVLNAPDIATAYRLVGNGLKTLSFAPALLLRPAHFAPQAQAAVIDSIAYQAATGTVPQGIPGGEYKALVRAYSWLARKYNCTVDQVQAIVWVVWRGSAV
jgi:hypothetical protein